MSKIIFYGMRYMEAWVDSSFETRNGNGRSHDRFIDLEGGQSPYWLVRGDGWYHDVGIDSGNGEGWYLSELLEEYKCQY